MRETVLYLDGAYIRVPEAALAAFVPGRALGVGVFETMRAAGGEIEFLQDHVDRMLSGLAALKIKHHFSAGQLRAVCRGVVRRNQSLPRARLRLLVFRQARVHCAAMVLPYTPPSASKYRAGLKAVILRTGRQPGAAQARVKSLDYGLFSSAHRTALSRGADEALLVNARGHIFESSRANVFILHKGQLLTPPLASGCLDGTMRRQVFRMAESMGVPVREQNISPAMVRKAEKIYLTNSLMGIIPCRV